ncbi:MAG: galactose mutarotase [Armatimonadetes bacterium]|nr:galactose mutarotase [Armatimonadota bacterium]
MKGTLERMILSPVTKTSFGKTYQGEDVDLFTLRNGGVEAVVSSLGATLVSLKVPDRDGKVDDIVLGYDDLASYEEDRSTYFGATIGRFANRISGGTFVLDGEKHCVTQNVGETSLHGGRDGFDKKVWSGIEDSTKHPLVMFALISPDGDEGYPGELTVVVKMQLTEEGALHIGYGASTTRTTVLNLTNHSYFNLAGAGNGNILSHELMILGSKYTPTNSDLIPTGEVLPVSDTRFDFRERRPIGESYDDNFCLDSKGGRVPQAAAEVLCPSSGRVMRVYTTEPGVQLYTGNFLTGMPPGKGGARYEKHAGFCLETQHYPDSPNHPEWPSVVLRPGEKFISETVYAFSTE